MRKGWSKTNKRWLAQKRQRTRTGDFRWKPGFWQPWTRPTRSFQGPRKLSLVKSPIQASLSSFARSATLSLTCSGSYLYEKTVFGVFWQNGDPDQKSLLRWPLLKFDSAGGVRKLSEIGPAVSKLRPFFWNLSARGCVALERLHLVVQKFA